MLHWLNRFNICCFLDNHEYHSTYQNIECLAAAGAIETFTAGENALESFSAFNRAQDDWLFGHLSYDLKNEIDAPLVSEHPDHIGFPDICFFRPETVLQLSGSVLTISTHTRKPSDIFAEISSETTTETRQTIPNLHITPRIEQGEYLSILEKLKQHILRGNCYEINFCQEFYAENAQINPLAVYQELTAVSPNPFACYYKSGNKYLLCASPERYLQKKGKQLISQPIKGTFKRNLQNPESDQMLKQLLAASEKDKSENVMVVDLVRNDLSRVCVEGSVKVDELFGVYSFPQVHQMISTISGVLKDGVDLTEIIKASFPMGSMTGAPKRRVMELIETFEKTKRGIYSGAVGYISPEKDFDFNVVIRSILYNKSNRYLSYLVGGGITFYSDPEQEYAECLLKAAAIKKVLEKKG